MDNFWLGFVAGIALMVVLAGIAIRRLEDRLNERWITCTVLQAELEEAHKTLAQCGVSQSVPCTAKSKRTMWGA